MGTVGKLERVWKKNVKDEHKNLHMACYGKKEWKLNKRNHCELGSAYFVETCAYTMVLNTDITSN